MTIILVVGFVLALGIVAAWLINDRSVYCNRMHPHRSQDTADACDARCWNTQHGSVLGPCPQCEEKAKELCVEDCMCDACSNRSVRRRLRLVEGGRQ